MDQALRTLLHEIERFGHANDETVTERPRRMLNITPDTGEFLAVLVRASAAKRVLEIGTSNGYSTLWLADAAAAVGGHVTTVELAEHKYALAAENLARAGLAGCVTQIHGEGGAALRDRVAASVDLLFLDSERDAYAGWWPDIRRVLRPGGLLVADNARSHAAELAPFVQLVEADPAFTCCTVPVGKGEFLATRAPA